MPTTKPTDARRDDEGDLSAAAHHHDARHTPADRPRDEDREDEGEGRSFAFDPTAELNEFARAAHAPARGPDDDDEGDDESTPRDDGDDDGEDSDDTLDPSGELDDAGGGIVEIIHETPDGGAETLVIEGAAGADDDAPAGRGGRRGDRRFGGRRGDRGGREARPAGPPLSRAAMRAAGRQLMLVNDLPGEECRVAVLDNGRIEALVMERPGTATNVGNIYKGRVTNVEPAIQAAFVDFGEGSSGFLHISDLHPKYFPGEERTERVGRKIPRRERPLIQESLRRGQEIVVQVLKEGLGSKGPTLTSYLSIPGRLMVMMPDMDRVGVSRKVEDEEQRRAMRKILDQLDLPEGFGFILRTAGFDRTKTELARDLAYLRRLWAVMERRMHSTGAPCLLYSEGDLLIRTIRDMADDHVEAIILDSEDAFTKARAFLEVVAPRSAPKVLYWNRAVPLFHAFDVERQIATLHSREVPLPSGGALVIDQTEALVAIDVNSGRSRSARDSETNAYRTNVEAVEEIARQLRLRDLGGVIVNDLIDMRSMKHRREIEDRFQAALKRDRAKTTITSISDFGVLEMTRQRMRPSVRKAHFMDCAHCHGLGEVKMPDSVAGDALREIEWLLSNERVRRVELVCSVRVASVLLSTKRHLLNLVETRSGKRFDVRISEAIAIDRVDLYAYDERGSDIEIDRLPRPHQPPLTELPDELPEAVERVEREEDDVEEVTEGGRRRRRRRRKPAPADTTAMILAGTFDDLPDAEPAEDEETIGEAIERERREEARNREQAKQQAAQAAQQQRQAAAAGGEAAEGEGGRRRRRRRRRGRGAAAEEIAPVAGTETAVAPVPPPPPPEPSSPTAVHLLAKELGLSSRDLLTRCHEAGWEVKSHMSKLTGEQVDQVKAWYAPPPPPPPPPAAPATSAARESRGSRSGGGEDGAGTPDAEGDEGGERRGRRRRRRRRRGGGGGGEGSSGGQPASADAESGERQAEGGADDSASETTDRGPGDSEGGRDGETESDGRGGRRRRRRRRRGGSGGGGGNGAGGPGGTPAPAAGSRNESRNEPRTETRGEPRGRSDGGGRRDRGEPRGGGPAASPRPASAAPSAPLPATPPPAAAPSATPATPKPRTLYGGRIRKIAGSKGGGGDDDR